MAKANLFRGTSQDINLYQILLTVLYTVLRSRKMLDRPTPNLFIRMYRSCLIFIKTVEVGPKSLRKNHSRWAK
jgi:hypothetical protein